MSSSNSTACLRCLLCLLLIGVIGSQLQEEQQETSTRIWLCRQRCYRRTLHTPLATLGQCRAQPDCFMCHDYCRVLLLAEWSLAKAMCADRSFCSRGCRTACGFHRL